MLKRKTPLKPGKRTKAWQKTRRKLREQFRMDGITSCEVKHEGCQGRWGLGFAHRHKRSWYLGKEELLGERKQVILACTHCHQLIEYDRKLSDYYFDKLRGEENV